MSPSTFLIIGATGGIGSALARQLAGAGHRLVLAARTEDRLLTLAGELDAVPVVADARIADDVALAFAQAADTGTPLSGVVNLAGSVLLKPAHRTTDDEWAETLDQNLTTSFHVVRQAGRVLARAGGSVVLCSSAAATLGLANHEAIAAAKAGVIGLARSAAATYAARGIRFNAVAPGLVETPLTAAISANEASRRSSLAMHASSRLGEPTDVARLIAFLLDPANDWITGQVFGVDGGLASTKLPPPLRLG